MKPSWHAYLSANVPRYCSYPTSLSFSDAVGADLLREKLEGITPYQPISLYVNVPFCASLCHYCGCQTSLCHHYERAQAYVSSISREIMRVGALLEGRGRVTAVHFGGGTPNYLAAHELSLILDAIESGFGLADSADVSMDIDPRLVSYNSAESMSALGVNRVSLGVQDFDPEVQRAIGRVQSFDHVAQVVSAFRNFGIFDIKLDLLYGLPKQSSESLRCTLELAHSLLPDRISLSGYAHKPAVSPHQKLIDEASLPSAQQRRDQLLSAQAYLHGQAYEFVGSDYFVKQDTSLARAVRNKTLKRNFQGYTTDPAEVILGFGQSAISQFDDLMVQNHRELSSYKSCIRAGNLPAYRGVSLSREDQARAKIIEDLLCYLKADVLARCTQFDVDLACLTPSLSRVEALRKEGLVTYKDGEIRIPEAARLISRVVASCFDNRLPEIMQSAYAV